MTSAPSSHERFDQSMASLIHHRWQDVWAAIPAAIEGTDTEGVHDVRVASRRLRAAMDVSVDAFPANWYRNLHKVAKQITSELGEVRDRDVQIEYLLAARETAEPGNQPGIDLLIERLQREREVAREHMLAFLANLEAKDIRGETERRFGAIERAS